jgi:site-specific DNA recombinase
LRIRFGSNKIDKETYDVSSDYLNDEINNISKELDSGEINLSNLENMVKKSLAKLGNISRIWASSDFDNRRALQRVLSPEGIFYNPENHDYRTRRVNSFIEFVNCASVACEKEKRGNPQTLIENSPTVARRRFELPTSGL